MIPMAEFFSNSRQYFENTLLFMPLGFLVPLLWRREQMVEKTVSIGFLFSLFIEAAQLFSFRATDIDDLLMNTMGTWLGYLLFLAINRIFPGRAADSAWEKSRSPEVCGQWRKQAVRRRKRKEMCKEMRRMPV